MKKFKYLLISLLALLPCLLFSACGSGEGKYVEGSLQFSTTYYSSFISAEWSFSVELPSPDNYTVTYKVSIIDHSTNKTLETVDKSSTVKADGRAKIQGSDMFLEYKNDYEPVADIEYDIAVSDVKITKGKNRPDPYKGYAIGFGTVGGLVLAGSIVCFVLLKKSENK